MRLTRLTSGIAALTTVASLAVALPAGAAKSGGSGTTSASSLTLVLLNSTDGHAHYGQSITWKVSTTATTQPFVTVICTQNGANVYTASSGYFAGYAWPWTQTMILSSGAWPGGAADCSARLYSASNTGKTTTLATTTFHVFA